MRKLTEFFSPVPPTQQEQGEGGTGPKLGRTGGRTGQGAREDRGQEADHTKQGQGEGSVEMPEVLLLVIVDLTTGKVHITGSSLSPNPQPKEKYPRQPPPIMVMQSFY